MRFKSTSDATRVKLALGLALTSVLAAGCRSKIDARIRGSKPAAAEAPLPEALELQDGKAFFQTRDSITVLIDKEVIDGAPSFSLLNVTEGEGEGQAVELIKEAPPVFGLADDGSFQLSERAGDKLLVTFFPGEKQWQGKFFYGKNRLKVLTEDDANPRFAYVELTLEDFDVFGVATASFDANAPIDDYQLQSSFEVFAQPAVTADGTMLTSGFFSMVNPQ